MSTRALASVVARIAVLPQATRNVDLLTEKNSRRCEKSQVARKAREHAERYRGRWLFRSRTTGASIHYALESQKDLAGAPIGFDVRQTCVDDAT
ncbi:hypothetical protein [Bradyrhizobium genomosp. III]|uniref:hypothetical protein n=1 Tax=Bradyrhizobium genomosp. III TaxID=2683271 RepID=UPI000577A61A|nr:hypothetical protein [Bradyrhizobium sp. CCBAU 15635]